MLGETLTAEMDWLDARFNLYFVCSTRHLRRHLKPGYRAFLYGPLGTGKTPISCLLGKSTRPWHKLYRVDSSMLVSKYLGETEKNLARVFDLAEHRRWILFLTKLILSLASAASAARPMIATPTREWLWQATFALSTEATAEEKFSLATDVNLEKFAEKYQLSGDTILNVLRYCVLLGLRYRRPITLGELQLGIQRELTKEGKTTWRPSTKPATYAQRALNQPPEPFAKLVDTPIMAPLLDGFQGVDSSVWRRSFRAFLADPYWSTFRA